MRDNSLFLRDNSLFRGALNLDRRMRNPDSFKAAEKLSARSFGTKFKKFPVLFSVSRDFDRRTVCFGLNPPPDFPHLVASEG